MKARVKAGGINGSSRWYAVPPHRVVLIEGDYFVMRGYPYSIGLKAVHDWYDDRQYYVTHAPTGRRVTGPVSRKKAIAIARAFEAKCPAFRTVKEFRAIKAQAKAVLNEATA